MNKEIKEILDNLSKEEKYIQHSYYRLFNYEANLLLDYITNLQEENEKNKEYSEFYKDMSDKWKNMSDMFKKSCEDYKSRNEKAIEYIRSQYTITDDDLYLALYSSDGTLDKLESILKGDDKE